MKNVLLAVMLACLALASVAASAADIPVWVYVNGVAQSYNPPAVLRGSSVYVPLRAGAASLGADVKWRADSHRAQVCTPNGCTLIRRSEGIMVNGRLLLPLRKMGQATGARVQWDAARRAVYITK